MSKLTHDYNNALWRVRHDTGMSLSFLHKAFLKESLGGSRPVSAYRFRSDVANHYHPAKKPMPMPAPHYKLHG